MADLPLTFAMTVDFPLSGQGRPPHKDVFGVQYPARLYLCERFDALVARRIASLEAKAGPRLPSTTPISNFLDNPGNLQ